MADWECLEDLLYNSNMGGDAELIGSVGGLSCPHES